MMGGYPAEKWGERGRITTTERNGGGGVGPGRSLEQKRRGRLGGQLSFPSDCFLQWPLKNFVTIKETKTRKEYHQIIRN